MTMAVATHATEPRRAPGWRPGPEVRLAALVLSGVALGVGHRHTVASLGDRGDERFELAASAIRDHIDRQDGRVPRLLERPDLCRPALAARDSVGT